eukprot:GDKI01044408.1.p1 GENE.GDKI01044408.1~~GDKI01044408.1.p1  ORF type:complete len:407 (+),score=57.63 GDKI01044408.1:2-1222(+)
MFSLCNRKTPGFLSVSSRKMALFGSSGSIMAGIRRQLREPGTIYSRLRDGENLTTVQRMKVTFSCSAVAMIGLMTYKYWEVVNVTGNPADITSTHRLFWLRTLFGRSRSRITGSIAETELPISWRAPFYKGFAKLYPMCNLEEVRFPLESYKSFARFFVRTLQDDARPIRDNSPHALISPCDCEVVTLGDVEGERVTQIKGATYNLRAFLGEDPRTTAQKNLKYCVLYLGPGDYHHFHSPCEYKVNARRHFSGECLPVLKAFCKKINDVFAVNERVVLTGEWTHGKMFYSAVAAYNVGNIRMWFDPKMRTNRLRVVPVYMGGDVFGRTYEKPIELARGERVGEFRLGSTIVLVFEAPEDFKWTVSENSRLRLGETLGYCSKLHTPPTDPNVSFGSCTAIIPERATA